MCFQELPCILFLKRFIYLLVGCAESSLLHVGFPHVVSGGCSSLHSAGFSLRGFSCRGAQAVGAGFSSCIAWAQLLQFPDSRVQAQSLWCAALVALLHVGSSCTRDQTSIPCIAKQIFNHWTTGEAHHVYLLKIKQPSYNVSVSGI